jgi:hypothetical protein
MIQYIIAAGIGVFLGSRSKKSKKSYADGGLIVSWFDKDINYQSKRFDTKKMEDAKRFFHQKQSEYLKPTLTTYDNDVILDSTYAKGGKMFVPQGREILYQDENVALQHNKVTDHYSMINPDTGVYMAKGGEVVPNYLKGKKTEVTKILLNGETEDSKLELMLYKGGDLDDINRAEYYTGDYIDLDRLNNQIHKLVKTHNLEEVYLKFPHDIYEFDQIILWTKDKMEKGGKTDDLGNPTEPKILEKMEIFIKNEIPKLDRGRFFTDGMQRKEAKKRFYQRFEYGAYNPKFSFDFAKGGKVEDGNSTAIPITGSLEGVDVKKVFEEGSAYHDFHEYTREEKDAIKKSEGSESDAYNAITLPKNFPWQTAEIISSVDPFEFITESTGWLVENGYDPKKYALWVHPKFGKNPKLLTNLITQNDESYFDVVFLVEISKDQKEYLERSNPFRSSYYAKGGEVSSVVNNLQKGDLLKIKFGSIASRDNEVSLKVRSRNKIRNGRIDKITFENVKNPDGARFYAYERGNGVFSFAMGDLAISNIEIVSDYAKGGEVIYTDTNNYANRRGNGGVKIWENYKNINNQKAVGSFSHNYEKRNVGDYYLFLLDDYDRKFYSHIPLKPNEMLFRNETERGRISKSLPLVKINIENGRVYFMSDENDFNSDIDDKNPKFNKASVNVNYLSLDDRIKKYNQGLITYNELIEDVDKTYAKGGVTEHGLQKGDTIIEDIFWTNKAVVKPKKGEKIIVDLDKGERFADFAKGGKTLPRPAKDFIAYVIDMDGNATLKYSKTFQGANRMMKNLMKNTQDFSTHGVTKYDPFYGTRIGGYISFEPIKGFAKGGKTNWVQDVVDSPDFRKGAFTKKAKERGLTPEEFMSKVLKNPDKYDERTRKQAQFMKNITD